MITYLTMIKRNDSIYNPGKDILYLEQGTHFILKFIRDEPEEYEIHDLIPQRPSYDNDDQLDSFRERSAGSRLFIRESNVFCHEGRLQEAGLIGIYRKTAAALWRYHSVVFT